MTDIVHAAVEIVQFAPDVNGKFYARCLNCEWESSLYPKEERASEVARKHLEKNHPQPLPSVDGATEGRRG